MRAKEVVTIAGIYKAYDIRGLAGEELDERIAYKIGRAFARSLGLKGKRVLIAEDMRPTSPAYSSALAHGLLAEGAKVTSIGLASTPLFYYATKSFDAGIIVTASHNPAQYNGFKFCREEAIPVGYDTGLQEVERLVTSGAIPEPEQALLAEQPDVQTIEPLNDFLTANLSFLRTSKPFTIVVDAANGMGGLTYKALAPLLKERGITLVPLFFELDGTFPNHEANPLKEESLTTLQERVRQERADVGLALDGDGDRCVFVDETGATVRADLFLALIAQELLQRSANKGRIILHDLRSSRVVRETISAAGGKPVMCRVGHAYIKAQMREQKALLAGELSGHFYPGEANYTENTMYALFQLLNLLGESNKTLSTLVQPLRKYAFSGEINSRVEDADAVLALVKERYATAPGVIDVSELDGIRVEFESWWFSLRKSNTEPVIRLIVEADSEEEMARRRDELLALVRG